MVDTSLSLYSSSSDLYSQYFDSALLTKSGMNSVESAISTAESIKTAYAGAEDKTKEVYKVATSEAEAEVTKETENTGASSSSSASSSTSPIKESEQEDDDYDEDMDYNDDGEVTIDEKIRYYSEQSVENMASGSGSTTSESTNRLTGYANMYTNMINSAYNFVSAGSSSTFTYSV